MVTVVFRVLQSDIKLIPLEMTAQPASRERCHKKENKRYTVKRTENLGGTQVDQIDCASFFEPLGDIFSALMKLVLVQIR